MFFKALKAGFISTLALFMVMSHHGISDAVAKTTADKASGHFQKGGTIEITVQDEDALTNTYYITNDGIVQIPLIGEVNVLNKTSVAIQNEITKKLKDGYINNPIVTVKTPALIQTTSIKQAKKAPNEKTVYIIGAVKKPGYYTLPENAHHLLSVIAIAGGYTDKANSKEFDIVRNIDGKHYRKTAQVGAIEYVDGDIIIIKERF